MALKKAGLWIVAALACFICLMSVPSVAEEGFGPGYVMTANTQTATNTIAADQIVEVVTPEGDTPIGNVITEETKNYQRGDLVGNFKIVGYYLTGKTYSGTQTTANRTIAADPTVLPIGTKVFINNTVYTVEDKGSAIKGNMIDIYFPTIEEARNVTYAGARYNDVYFTVPKATA